MIVQYIVTGVLNVKIRAFFVSVVCLSLLFIGACSNIQPQTQNDMQLIKVSFSALTSEKLELSITTNHLVSSIDYQLLDSNLDEIQAGVLRFENDATSLVITGLEPDKEYLLRFNQYGKTVLQIPFKTFGSINSIFGFKLFYFIDLTDSKSGYVKVTIFGQFNDGPALLIKRHTYHLPLNSGMTLVERPSVTLYEVSGEVGVSINESMYEIFIDPRGKSGYFKIEYICDKSKRASTKDFLQGYLCEKYFMASHEQFMFFPECEDENDLKRFSISAVIPYGWKLNTWWVSSGIGVLYAPSKKSGENWEIGSTLAATHFYAYDPNHFNEYQRKIEDTNIIVIKDKNISEPWEEYTFKVYDKLVELWGGDVDYRKYDYRDYVVMYVDDSVWIYAGEYTDAQGFSTAFGFSEMVVHQIFHRWNGWVCGIRVAVDSPFEHPGLWHEGFNEFYCDKVLTELNLTYPHRFLKEWYSFYKSFHGTSKDAPIVRFDPSKHSSFVIYGKGAVVTYYMDKRLREITSNQHSMDDVLKYFLRNWKENNHPFTYQELMGFLKQLGGQDYVDEIREILYENKKIVLPEFEG